MSIFKTTILGLLLVMVAFAAPAVAASTELVFVIDASGSISPSNFTLQMTGYHNAIEAVVPMDGSVAIAGVLFGGNTVLLQPLVDITAANKSTVADTFLNATRAGVNTGATNISAGIFTGEGELTGGAVRAVIDVSTDGGFNQGFDPAGPAGNPGTSRWAVANDADLVNALGIGVVPNFAFGPGSFNVTVASFADFEAALREKIQREIIPEPGSIALLGLGILGIGGFAIRRRRRS